MTNGFRGLLVGGGEPIYVKLKEVEKLAVRHFKARGLVLNKSYLQKVRHSVIKTYSHLAKVTARINRRNSN